MRHPAVTFLLLGCLLLFAGCQTSPSKNATNPDRQAHARFAGTVRRQVQLEYLAHVPGGKPPGGGTRWPALLFLHGAGERGTNLSAVAVHGPPLLVKECKPMPFIVISPQCPPGQRWDADALRALAHQVLRKYPIDPDRFYLTGLSMGGGGTWELAAAEPGLFAAIAPICGRANTSLAPRLRELPTWVFHGAKDDVVPISASQEMVDAVRSAGGSVKFTIYPEAGHDSWTTAYNNPLLYQWLLEHRLSDRRNPLPGR